MLICKGVYVRWTDGTFTHTKLTTSKVIAKKKTLSSLLNYNINITAYTSIDIPQVKTILISKYDFLHRLLPHLRKTNSHKKLGYIELILKSRLRLLSSRSRCGISSDVIYLGSNFSCLRCFFFSDVPPGSRLSFLTNLGATHSITNVSFTPERHNGKLQKSFLSLRLHWFSPTTTSARNHNYN